ncbi:MAG TPA: type II toxin-antitoxin system Phd/YefM family antitoxin [Patescibacteria group bacterium]|nr:type II toxin-antitoxin system Phd/YefM family antitoxin [Patescibacteria group bacterium]
MASISNVLPASEARNNFYTMLDEVNTKLKTFTITLRGKVKAILISPDELESWRETLEIMADEKLVKDIRKSQSEVKRGKFITEEKLLKELGINPKDLD